MSIKTTFSDVAKLYKNLVHWNLSKLSIYVFSLIIALGVTLPVVFVSIIICWILGIDWVGYTLAYQSNSLNTTVLQTADFWIYALFAVISVAVFFLMYAYARVMYFDLNLQYLENKKASYMKKEFFSVGKILRFFSIAGYGFLYLFIPVVIAFFGSILIVVLNGGVNDTGVSISNGSQFLSVSFLILAVVSVILFIYISYRLFFGFIALVDTKKYPQLQSAKTYVKDSIEMTKGVKKFMKLLLTLLIFSLIFSPFFYIFQGIENTYNQIKTVKAFELLPSESKLLYLEQQPDFALVVKKYENIPSEILEKNIFVYKYILLALGIVTFIFIEGISDMIMVSHYRQISQVRTQDNKI